MADDTTALAVNGARHYIDLILQRNPTDPQDIFNPTSAEDAAKLDDTRLITKLEVITNAYHEASRFFNRFVVAHLPAFLELQKRMNSRGSKDGKQFRVNGRECAGFKDALVALGFNPSYFYTVVREIRGKEVAKQLGAGDRSAAAVKANETRKAATETTVTDISLDDATDAEECEPELKVEVLNEPDAPPDGDAPTITLEGAVGMYATLLADYTRVNEEQGKKDIVSEGRRLALVKAEGKIAKLEERLKKEKEQPKFTGMRSCAAYLKQLLAEKHPQGRQGFVTQFLGAFTSEELAYLLRAISARDKDGFISGLAKGKVYTQQDVESYEEKYGKRQIHPLAQWKDEPAEEQEAAEEQREKDDKSVEMAGEEAESAKEAREVDRICERAKAARKPRDLTDEQFLAALEKEGMRFFGDTLPHIKYGKRMQMPGGTPEQMASKRYLLRRALEFKAECDAEKEQAAASTGGQPVQEAHR